MNSRDNFDWKFYINKYEDLRKANIDTEKKALDHWKRYGKKEGRICNNDIIDDKINDKFKITVRLCGQIYGLTGYGTGCRNYIKHLLSLPYIILYIEYMHDYNEDISKFKDYEFMKYVRESPERVDYDIIVSSPRKSLQHKNAKYTIWCWYWEVNILPDNIYDFLKHHPNHINISPSKFLTEAIRNSGLYNPCYTIKHWHLPNNKVVKEKNDTIKFYTISIDAPRKNLELLLESYYEEFTCDDNVEFIAKISPYLRPINVIIDKINSFKNDKSAKLQIITDFLTDVEIQNMHNSYDIFALAQHSEGWGIPHIEALLSGNPLVTVNYGSLPDFVNDTNAFEIPFVVSEIDRSNRYKNDTLDFYPLGSIWAISKKEDIKIKLREAYNNYKNKKPNIEYLTKYFSFEESLKQWNLFFVPKISLITSMFKASKYLEQFMVDVTRQTIFKEKCEWIILDANPIGDNTDYNMIKDYIDMYPNNIIYKKLDIDKGIYDTWNQGIQMSTGEFITNMNCDDRRVPDNLEKMALFLLNNPNISLVYCNSYIINEGNINWEKIQENPELYKIYIMEEFSKNALLKFNFPHNNPLWRRSLHDKYGYFDTKYKSAGDAEFWLRCASNGATFKKYPNEILGIYYDNPEGMSTKKENVRKFIKNENKEIKSKYKKLIF